MRRTINILRLLGLYGENKTNSTTLATMPQFLGNNVKFLESKCLVRAFWFVGEEGKVANAVNAKTNSTTLATTPKFLGSKGHV